MAGWILISHRTPVEPSTARVSVWRALHRLGAVYLGPSVCMLPAVVADRRHLETIAARVAGAGGSFETFEIEAFSPSSDASLRARFDAARAEEYAEVVERADAIVDELEREAAGGKLSYAEVEENEAGLTKLRSWLRRVEARDAFGCPARAEAEAAVDRAQARLGAFVQSAMSRETSAEEMR